ncbi:unnamed protein product [Rotaria socialis]
MHEIWQMKKDASHVTHKIQFFMHEEINCSSCKTAGLTNFVLYDIPRFLIFKTESINTDCITLIDDINQLRIRPLDTNLPFDYHLQTVLIVPEEDDIVYLRKTTNGYTSFNKTTAEKMQPDKLAINAVQDLLPTFTDILKIGLVQLKNDIKTLLDNDADINDLIINVHLLITASTAPFHKHVLVVESHTVSNIIENKLKYVRTSWLDYDIILCPINQKHDWYLMIIDLERNLFIQFDSLPAHDIPRIQNLERLIHILNTQHYLKHDTNIDFRTAWTLSDPGEDFDLYQNNVHLCGAHLLIQAKAYTNRERY